MRVDYHTLAINRALWPDSKIHNGLVIVSRRTELSSFSTTFLLTFLTIEEQIDFSRRPTAVRSTIVMIERFMACKIVPDLLSDCATFIAGNQKPKTAEADRTRMERCSTFAYHNLVSPSSAPSCAIEFLNDSGTARWLHASGSESQWLVGHQSVVHWAAATWLWRAQACSASQVSPLKESLHTDRMRRRCRQC